MIFTTLLSADTVLQVSKNPWSYVISWAIQYPKKEYFWTLSYKKLWRIFMFIYIAVSSFLPCFLVCNLFCKRYFGERGKHDRLFFNTKCQIAYHISISPQKFFIEPRQENGSWCKVSNFSLLTFMEALVAISPGCWILFKGQHNHVVYQP